MSEFAGFSSDELKRVEKVMLRRLDDLHDAILAAQYREARELPCGGGCRDITWPNDVLNCTAYHHQTDLACQLQEHHIGQHVHCNSESDDPLQHNILRWADEKREVA